MAGPLKNMLRQYLASQGVANESIEEMIEGAMKHEPQRVLGGKTPRHAMQTLGTEWGRDCMGVDFWCDAAKTQILKSVKNGLSVVVDDVRFPNEAKMIQDIGGFMVCVRRPGQERQIKKSFWKSLFSKGHRSEGSLNGWPFDLDLINDYKTSDDFAHNAAREIITLVHSGKSERAQTEVSHRSYIGR
jgi:hypothetical protein